MWLMEVVIRQAALAAMVVTDHESLWLQDVARQVPRQVMAVVITHQLPMVEVCLVMVMTYRAALVLRMSWTKTAANDVFLCHVLAR